VRKFPFLIQIRAFGYKRVLRLVRGARPSIITTLSGYTRTAFAVILVLDKAKDFVELGKTAYTVLKGVLCVCRYCRVRRTQTVSVAVQTLETRFTEPSARRITTASGWSVPIASAIAQRSEGLVGYGDVSTYWDRTSDRSEEVVDYDDNPPYWDPDHRD
jgi:hypothetical protein